MPKRDPSALSIGKAVHSAFEAHFNTGESVGTCLQSILDETKDSLLTDQEQKDRAVLQDLVEPLSLWTDAYQIEETLEVEQPFSFRLPTGQDFVGRPDRVVVIHGSVFHFQHKTLAGTRDVGAFLTAAQRSMHENIYAWHLMRKYGHLPYGGTIYNIIRKLKYRSTAKGKEDKILHPVEEMIVQAPVAIDPSRVEATKREIEIIAAKMVRTTTEYERGGVIVSNRKLDTNVYTGRLDPYFPVLMNEVSLDDDRYFKDRDNPYEGDADATNDV